MFTNKRGVSPLIATVLIIGFTVALAAIIFTWGQSFVRETTQQTADSTEQSLTCSRVNFEVNIKCPTGLLAGQTQLESIQINNLGNNVIKSAKLRAYFKDGTVQIGDLDDIDIASFNINTYSSSSIPALPQVIRNPDIDKLEVIPTLVTESGNKVTCPESIRTKTVTCT